jgi:hypothetical protein
MRAFLAEKNAIKRDEIAARQLHALKQHCTGKLRLAEPARDRPYQAGRSRYWIKIKNRDAPGDGPGDGFNRVMRSRRAYFSELLIEVNLALRLVPRPFTAARMTIEIPAAISPYSMAVAPESSRKNFKTKFFIVLLRLL